MKISVQRDATVILISAVLAFSLISSHGSAYASYIDLLPDDFLSIEQPSYLNGSIFSGGFLSESYGEILEGVDVEQSLTPYMNLFGRAAGFQTFSSGAPGRLIPLDDVDHDFPTPIFVPSSAFPPQAQVNVGRFQGGVDLLLSAETSLLISGGVDVGVDHSPIFESDFNGWFLPHSLHPLYLSTSSLYVFQHSATANSIDLQIVTLSTKNWTILAGVGGAIYKGGLISGIHIVNQTTEGHDVGDLNKFTTNLGSARPLEGQGGADLGAYNRLWGWGISLQLGYGSLHEYGQISLYKQFTFLD